VQEEEYNMPLTAAERKQKSTELTRVCIKLRQLAAERKSLMHELKEKKDNLKEDQNRLIDELQQNGRYVKGKVYIIADRTNMMVGKYDKLGNLLEQHKMQKQDMQLSIQEYMNTGTE